MITFRYESCAFNEQSFLRNGAFAAVVLNYNKAGLIGSAVMSALTQDFPCYEVLAMDDASTDGSADEMENTIRAYVASHPERPLKITVVRNETNRTTLGQWRQAVMLSSAAWFGMFCGDDQSYPDRLTYAARCLRAHPTAAGFCTNYTDGNSLKMHWNETADPGTQLGCTSFWHRRVLSLDLPPGVLDDFMLTWIAKIAKAGELICDLSRATVHYSVGTGVTTQTSSDYAGVLARGRRFGRRVWDAIKLFDEKYGRDPVLSRRIRGEWVASWTEGGNWWIRLKAVWVVLIVDRSQDYGGSRREIVRKVLGRFLTRLLGPVSFWIVHHG